MSDDLNSIPAAATPKEALERAAQQFEYYALNHRAKADRLRYDDSFTHFQQQEDAVRDTTHKATINEAMARLCRNSMKSLR